MTFFSRVSFRALLFLAVVGLIGVLPAHAQEGGSMSSGSEPVDQPVRHQGSFSFSTSVPRGGFSNAVSGSSLGGDISYGYRLFDLPVGSVYGGGDLDFGTYGAESAPYIANTRFEIRSFLFQPQVSLRLQPKSGTFRPFLEGLAGFNVLFTGASIQGEESENEQIPPELLDEAEGGGASTNFGVGAGVDYRFARIEGEALGLSLSVQYLYGGQAEIPTVVEGTTGIDVNTVEENTTVIQTEVGVYFDF